MSEGECAASTALTSAVLVALCFDGVVATTVLLITTSMTGTQYVNPAYERASLVSSSPAGVFVVRVQFRAQSLAPGGLVMRHAHCPVDDGVALSDCGW